MAERSRRKSSSTGTGTARQPASVGAHLVGRVATAGYSTVSRSGVAQAQPLGQRRRRTPWCRRRRRRAGGLRRRRSGGASSRLAAARSARCRSTAGSPARRPTSERVEHRRGGRIARGADREVDHAALVGVGDRRELVEAVVGVGRRDEARVVLHERLALTTGLRRDELGEPAGRAASRRARTRMPSSLVRLRDDLALAVQRGQHVAAVVGDQQLDDVGQRPQPVAERSRAGRRRPRRSPPRSPPTPGGRRRAAWPHRRRSALLNTSSSGTRSGADLGQHDAHRVDLAVGSGDDGVDDVDQQVGSRPPLRAST